MLNIIIILSYTHTSLYGHNPKAVIILKVVKIIISPYHHLHSPTEKSIQLSNHTIILPFSPRVEFSSGTLFSPIASIFYIVVTPPVLLSSMYIIIIMLNS